MKIIDILSDKKVHISCELFPPKQGAQLENAKGLIREMAKLSPSYMSVTYGAMGGTSQFTRDMADEVQNGCGIPALAHLTCVSATKSTVQETVSALKEKGIKNILALRGDFPDGEEAVSGDYKYASELIADIRQYGDFCIGGACYPEGHPEAPSLSADIESLRSKVSAGCEFLTTQMFFDNNILYSFLYRLLKAGVDVPVVAGIMPVTRANQVSRIKSISGNILPRKFLAMVERFGDDPECMLQAGIAYATEQMIDLVSNGVNNIHIYTMNRPEVAARIFDNVSSIIGK